jgi:hypothetical protein
MTPGFACIWSTCRRAGELTSVTATAEAPAASFGQPLPAGAGAGAGAGVAEAAAMTALGTDVAVSVPSAFRPVTWTRIALPWSFDLIEYSFPVAPVMSWQAPPFWSQMRHW